MLHCSKSQGIMSHQLSFLRGTVAVYLTEGIVMTDDSW